MSSANAQTNRIYQPQPGRRVRIRTRLRTVQAKYSWEIWMSNFHQTFVMATLEEANALLEAERQKLQTAGGTLSRIV